MKPTRPTPAQLRALARRDPVLGTALKRVPRYPGFPNRDQPYRTHYQALARSITSQQLSTKAARTIHDRVCALTPGRSFPRPPELLELTDGALRGAGLSQGKLLALRDLATRIEDGSLRLAPIGRKGDEDVIEALTRVRGIGVWTAQMFLMFRLGRLDVMAGGDLGLQEGLRRLDGLDERPGPAELLERAEVWAPLRSVASWVLWRILEEEAG
ncbi:MAG: DNA-3-methyladenine glycosylase 2 family protein [bacterium]|nr:DNA-3-methyladenine glycosylase 2 family protein [bacterium]